MSKGYTETGWTPDSLELITALSKDKGRKEVKKPKKAKE